MNKHNNIPIHYIDVSSTANKQNITVHKPNAHQKIYVRAVKGTIETMRRYIGLMSLSIFLILPWVQFHGQQAIMLDFFGQRFHLFGLTLWPQDLTLFAWLFIIAAFALFFITVILGRVWCGFVCPQTVFTFLFVWVEEQIEGSRNKRIHLDKQPTSTSKLAKKISKHSVWMLIAFITSFTFVGYFMPINTLFIEIVSLEISFWPAFYVMLFALCTYANAGWMRELMCTHMCPYSRFQSAMFDGDTLTVTYDKSRGEGRGPRSKKLSQSQYKNKGLGDCIDCYLCVQVCPTGIDIRNGLQYECINCGACVDACNDVMSKMEYQTGLISYTSENSLKGKSPKLLRPKVVGYFVVLLIMLSALIFDVSTRKDFDIDVIRDRTSLFGETKEGNIKNVYTLVIRNKTQVKQSFSLKVAGLQTLEILGSKNLAVKGSELMRYPISIVVAPKALHTMINKFDIIVVSENGNEVSKGITFVYQ